MPRPRRSILFIALLAAAAIAAVERPSLAAAQPAQGKFLIAARKLGDPNFAETVILLIDYSEKGAMGLIVNRATPVKLSKLLPRIFDLKDRPNTVYLGGPVESGSIFLLIRSEEEVEEAERVFADVHFGAGSDLLKQMAQQQAGADRFRGFAGYAGWGAGQLDSEIARRDWYVVPGDASTVFDPAPESVWSRLIERTQVRFARAALRSSGVHP